MQLKKEDQCVDASIVHRIGNKIITGARGREGPGRSRGGEEKKKNPTGLGKGIGKDRREVKRIRKFNRNM
jgi:hypothetical protein